MKRIVWTFGLISGAVISVLMSANMMLVDSANEHGLILGYATMVAAFAMIWFGVRSYRDNVLGGSIGFGRALSTGLLIMLISSCFYVATWEVIYHKFMPDFADKYAAQALEKAKAQGKSAQEIEATRVQVADFKKMYANPLLFIGLTLLEPVPVGVLVSLVTAGILSRRKAAVGAIVPRTDMP